MGTFSTTTSKNAKSVGEAVFAKPKSGSDFCGQIVEIIKRAWPRKTAAHVAYVAGVSERSVQFWLAGETRMSLDNVAALLKTDAGYDILAAIMGDAKPAWWVNTQLAQGIRESKRAVAREMKRTANLRALQDQINLFDQ